MRTETETFSDSLLSADWIQKSGKRRSVVNERLVDDWNDAEEVSLSEDYSSFLNSMSNRLSRAVHEALDPDDEWNEDNPWDDFVQAWKRKYREQFLSKAKRVLAAIGSNSAELPNMLASGILGAALETEFSEWAPTRFYREQCDWLANGYWACFWDGDIEEGQVVLFDLVRATGTSNKPKKRRAKAEDEWDPNCPMQREDFFKDLPTATAEGRRVALDKFMQELLSVDWLRGVGKPLADPPTGGKLLMTWDDAWSSYLSESFKKARSDYATRLENAVADRQSNKEWAELSSYWTEQFLESTRLNIRKAVPMHSHTKARNEAITHQIKFGALEVAFADVAPNRFFRDWSYWWWRGYFPVEWNGGPIPESLRHLVPLEMRDQELPIDFGVF